jgi:excisionase family DNA binding protein
MTDIPNTDPFPPAFNIADYMPLSEAAKTLGCHENSIRAWIKKGKLKAVRVGEWRLYVSRKDVSAFPTIVLPSNT